MVVACLLTWSLAREETPGSKYFFLRKKQHTRLQLALTGRLARCKHQTVSWVRSWGFVPTKRNKERKPGSSPDPVNLLSLCFEYSSALLLTEEIRLEIFGSPHLPDFWVDLFSNWDSVYSSENLEFWGFPRKRFWYVRGLVWELVWNLGSRDYFKCDLLRRGCNWVPKNEESAHFVCMDHWWLQTNLKGWMCETPEKNKFFGNGWHWFSPNAKYFGASEKFEPLIANAGL